jgi:hypothetical protein
MLEHNPTDNNNNNHFLEVKKRPESSSKVALRLLKKAPDLVDDPANALKGQFGEIVEKFIYAFLGFTQTFMHSAELYEAYGEFNDGKNKKANAWIIFLAATGIGFAVTLFIAGLASLLPALAFLESGILIPMNILFLISSSLLVNIFFAKFMVTLHEWREGKKQKKETVISDNAPDNLGEGHNNHSERNNREETDIPHKDPAKIRKEAIHNFIQLTAATVILTCNMLMNFVPALDITIFTTMGIPLSPPALIAIICSLIGMTNELLRGADLGALKERFKSLEPHLMLKLFAGVVCIACLVVGASPLNLPSVPFLNISLPAAVFLASVAMVISDLIVMGLSARFNKKSDKISDQLNREKAQEEGDSTARPQPELISESRRSSSASSSTSTEASRASSNPAAFMHHQKNSQTSKTSTPQAEGSPPEETYFQHDPKHTK